MSLTLALGIGLVLSLGLSELLSIAPGGYIVPGYIAVNMDHPARIAATIGVALATLLVMNGVGRFVILFGMRRFVVYLLVGFGLGMAYAAFVAERTHSPIEAIGFVVPGLIALWMDKQGFAVTVGSLATVAILARLALLVAIGL